MKSKDNHGEDAHSSNPYLPGEAALADAPGADGRLTGRYLPDPDVDYGIGATFGAMMRATTDLWRANVGALALVALPAALVDLAVGLWLGPSLEGESLLASMSSMGSIVSLPLALAAWGGTFILLDERVRHGVKARGAFAAFLRGFRYAGSFFGLSFVMGLLMIPALLPGLVLIGLELRAAGIPLAVAGGLVDAYLLLRWSVAGVVLVTEGAGAKSAIERSSALLRGRMWLAGGFMLTCLAVMAGALAIFHLVASTAVGIAGLPPFAADLASNLFNTTLPAQFLSVASFVLYAAFRRPAKREGA